MFMNKISIPRGSFSHHGSNTDIAKTPTLPTKTPSQMKMSSNRDSIAVKIQKDRPPKVVKVKNPVSSHAREVIQFFQQ